MRTLGIAALLLATSMAWPQDVADRAGTGSRSQALEAPGLSNFHKVSDSLYRSAQPTAEGFRSLKALGVTTVVNLRSFSSDRKKIGTTGLAYEHIYMKAWHPEHEEIVRFLQIVGDPRRQPVLVHCQHGSDRTGTMVAAYRIVVEGWSKEDAVAEMTSEPFGFHRVWRNLPKWVQELDVEAIRREAGLEPAAP
jgi:protein tyrosine/serine phosphatase